MPYREKQITAQKLTMKINDEPIMFQGWIAVLNNRSKLNSIVWIVCCRSLSFLSMSFIFTWKCVSRSSRLLLVEFVSRWIEANSVKSTNWSVSFLSRCLIAEFFLIASNSRRWNKTNFNDDLLLFLCKIQSFHENIIILTDWFRRSFANSLDKKNLWTYFSRRESVNFCETIAMSNAATRIPMILAKVATP